MSAYEQIKLDLSGFRPLGEKMKLLNKFIVQTKESEVSNILKNCEDLPDTQYNLLKLLLADKFHLSDLVIDLLREGDSVTLNRAVTKRWLYEGEDSKLVDSEFLLKKLFPNVSYSCRQKVLYRIGRLIRNEEKADEIWNAVEQRYGFDVAFPILPACSKVKISSMIENRRVELSGYQLVQVLEKYPDVGMEYLKKHYAAVGISSRNAYRSPLDYLYEHRPNEFLDLCINYPDKINSFSFGRGRSTKIIRTYREKLLQNPSKFSSILKFDRIRREFSNEEFQMLFESTLAGNTPANVYSSDNMWIWVRSVPINNRMEMVNQAFMKLFQINLDEHQNYMCPEYIVLLPDDKRLSVIQWKIQNDASNSWSFKNISSRWFDDESKKRAWMPLKPTSHSVPELQKLLLIEQDIHKRVTLSQYLLETCYINEDLPQLKKVLILLSKRSRNDQSDVREIIFETINNIMKSIEFCKEHWDVIIEIIQVSLVFEDDLAYVDKDKEQIVEKCLAFHLESKLPLNNLVSMHIKLKIQTSSSSWINSYITNIVDRRILLESYVNELENLKLTENLSCYNGTALESESFAEFIVNLTEEICKFNIQAKVSNDSDPILISAHPWLCHTLQDIAKEEDDRFRNNQTSVYNWHFAKQLVDIIETLRKEENMSLEFHSSNDILLEMLPDDSILVNFWKNPSDQDWSTILSKVIKYESTIKFIKKLKFWNYSTIVNQLIKMYSEIIIQTVEGDSKVTIKQKCTAVLVLSVLREAVDFISLVAKFYPPDTKVDVFAEKSEHDYQIRQAFAKSLVNVTNPHLTFPAIEKFCVGDYLKLIIGCFYSQTGRAKEVVSMEFLRKKVVDSPVSLQKHIIRQFFTISSVEDRIRILSEIDSSNVSIRSEVFKQANKLLRTSPSKETWNILKKILEKTSTDDAPIIQFLRSTPKLDTFPLEYISEYIETCLVLLRKLKADTVESFLNHIESVIGKLSEKTLDDIMFYENGDQFNCKFCITYLQSSSSKSILEHRLSNILSILEIVIRNGWDKKQPKMWCEYAFEYPTKILVWSFISRLCTEKIDKTTIWLKSQVFQTLLSKFKVESVTKFIRIILFLELSLLIIKEVENNGNVQLRSFGCSLARFTDSLVKTYGGEILYIFQYIVMVYVQAYFCHELGTDNCVIVELIDGILETSKSRQNLILAISFLENINPKTKNMGSVFDKINAVLSQSEDTIVQMYCSHKSH